MDAGLLDERITRWAGRRRNLVVLGTALLEVLECCYGERLKCVDPPVATTGMLYSMGFGQYTIRRFWDELPLGVSTIPIYRYLNSEFVIEVEHSVGPALELRCGSKLIPVDRLDARGADTIFSPRTHKVYLRILGRIEGNMIRVNLVRLSKLMETYEPGMMREVVRGILGSNEDMAGKLLEIVMREIRRWEGILRFLLPYIPRDKENLFKTSPALRWIAG